MEQTVTKIKKKISTMSWLSIVILSILIVYSIIFFTVMVWGFFTSVQSIRWFETYKNQVWPESLLPWKWEFRNYYDVFMSFQLTTKVKTFFVQDMFLNSILYAGIGAFLHATVSCLMAYLVAKFKYKTSGIIYWLVIMTMTIPIVGSDISNIQLLDTLGLYDEFLGAWLLKFNFTGTYFLVFHATFARIPDDYAEAANIDGAGETTIFLRIIFPMVSSTFFTVFLLYLISLWNDYQVPLLYLPSHPTLSYGLQVLSRGTLQADETGGIDYGYIPYRLASCFMVALPIMIVFLLFRKRIMNKLDMGGIKE